jgi:UDP-N-acetylglucosamine 4,6-dehydratase/UDP-glucose 4-epimerase
MNTNKVALITGGSGFLGKKLIQYLLDLNYKVRIVARNEGNLIMMKNLYPQIEIVPGDICDKITAYQVCKDVNCIFHLAAFKHVRMAEEYSIECINTNVVGTLNILEQTLENKNLEFVVGISTDKVAKVSGVYGASKYLMESIFKQYERMNPSVKYRLVRYGNVLYSTGSVLCIWKDKLQRGEEIVITDRKMTRFYWTIDEAIKLIFDCLKNSTNCEPYLPVMKSMYLGDILSAMAKKYLPTDMELKIKEIGLQVGENLHEALVMNGYTSEDAEKYTIDEIYNMI